MLFRSNVSERKKHILENMLYMGELNRKNAYICRKIFDIKGEYKLNLYIGDALMLDPQKKWKVDKFDIIMGNPPYNKGGIRSSSKKKSETETKTETVWPKFVDKSLGLLKDKGYLVFIHPLAWLKKSDPPKTTNPSKITKSLHDKLLEKHVVWLKLWDSSKSKTVINGEIPISLYVLHNIVNTEQHKTKIISEIQRKQTTTKSFMYLDPKYSIPLACIQCSP